jgi:hypothetical protein
VADMEADAQQAVRRGILGIVEVMQLVEGDGK